MEPQQILSGTERSYGLRDRRAVIGERKHNHVATSVRHNLRFLGISLGAPYATRIDSEPRGCLRRYSAPVERRFCCPRW
jgi:hypothetical protein